MDRLIQAKLALALGGIALFGAGIRFENDALRLAGMIVLAVAFLLRFIRTKS